MFDSPLQNRSDEVSRYTVAYFIWFYPVTYVVTLLQPCSATAPISRNKI
jgi:hypothetical protein